MSQIGHWIKRPAPVNEELRHARDSQLLAQYLGVANEQAFAMLVRRHGPLVLSVCRRILTNTHDADDAFQATFLVLARRARAIRKVDSLAAWLHGVALRLAIKMKSKSIKRQERERQGAKPAKQEGLPDLGVRESWEALHQELKRLPDKEQQPIFLCYFEGLTQEEAAQRLGWPRGTLKRRLERGRELMRVRLMRRGLCLAAIAFPFVNDVSASAAPVIVPAALNDVTVEASVLVAARKALPVSLASRQVFSLVQENVHAMMLSRLRTIAVVLLASVLGTFGAWLYGFRETSESPKCVPTRAEAIPAAPMTVKTAKEELLPDVGRIVKMLSGAEFKSRMALVPGRVVERITFGGSRCELPGFSVSVLQHWLRS
jgi:RNA polymerase sigma factor (sigma-70 family)